MRTNRWSIAVAGVLRGFATAFGPLLIAQMRQTSGNYRGALHVIAIVMLVSISLPLNVSPPRSTSWDLLKGAKGPHGSVESVRVDVLVVEL